MDNIVNIFLGGILISSVLAVAYRGFVLSSRPAGDIYTHDKDKAKYGKHVGRPDKGLDAEIRKQVYKKYGRKCFITKRPGIPGDADTGLEHIAVGVGVLKQLHVGHIIPHALGGETEIDNLRPMDADLNEILSDAITPMAEKLCRERGVKIWSQGIKKMTWDEAKKRLAKKNKRK